MPKDPLVNVRVPQSLARSLDGLARHAGLSKSEVIRMLLAESLDRHFGSVPQPTDAERQPTMSVT